MKKLLSIFILLGIITALPTHAGEEYCTWKVEDFSINEALCGLAGNPDRGRKLAINRKKGNCLACHVMPIPEESFHGNIGPPLAGAASRYKEGQLRLRMVDMKDINPMTLMPGFYKHPDKLHRVKKEFQGKTPLTAQEVEDIIAYLITLE